MLPTVPPQKCIFVNIQATTEIKDELFEITCGYRGNQWVPALVICTQKY